MFDRIAVLSMNLFAQGPAATPGSGIPNPGNGVAPPGAEGLLTILQWATYLGFGFCVLGVVIAGATMAIQHRNGTAGDNGARLGWVLGGSLIIGSASALVSAVI